MRRITFATLILIGCSFMLGAKEPSPTPSTPTQKQLHMNQPKLLDQTLTEYTQGKYTHFLKRMHNDYLDANKKWKYNNLLKQRKERSKLSLLAQNYTKTTSNPFSEKAQNLRENQNRELIEACIHHPNAKLSREVKDMIFFTPTQEEQDSLDYLSQLSFKFKGEGKTPLENQLIAIDTEFWLKQLSLEIALTEQKIDNETFQKQSLVLQLEKLYQMKQAVQVKEADPQIKQLIETASQVYPKVKAFALTRKYLLALGKEKKPADTPIEKQIQRIVKKYISQEEALVAEYFPSTNTNQTIAQTIEKPSP